MERFTAKGVGKGGTGQSPIGATVSGILDTSMVVRYLRGDSPELARRAASVIDEEDGLQLTDVVLAETAYVLSSVYRVPREAVVDHLIAFLQKQNIEVLVWTRAWYSKPCCSADRPGASRMLTP
jgi:hypothetical protein